MTRCALFNATSPAGRFIAYGVPSVFPENPLQWSDVHFEIVENRYGITGTEQVYLTEPLSLRAKAINDGGGFAAVVRARVHGSIRFECVAADDPAAYARAFDVAPCGVASFERLDGRPVEALQRLQAELDAYAGYLNGEQVDLLIYELDARARVLLEAGVDLTDAPGVQPVDTVTCFQSAEDAETDAPLYLREIDEGAA